MSLGPDFFLNILLQSRNANPDVVDQVREDIYRAFVFLSQARQGRQLAYNYDFVRFIGEEEGRFLFEIEERSAPLPNVPDDLGAWQEEHIALLRKEYEGWHKIREKGHVFSYFIFMQGQHAFIGTLQAKIEKDEKNIPDYHITGKNIPENIKKSVKESVSLVRHYLIGNGKINPGVVEEALKPVVILWEESIVSQCASFKGDSFNFLFASLFFTCTLRSLAQKNVLCVKDKCTQKVLVPEHIQIPSDIIMSGSFQNELLPDETLWEKSYCPIPSSKVADIHVKIQAAEDVNTIYPTFGKFLFPWENEPVLAECQQKTISLIPIRNSHDFFQTFFVVEKKHSTFFKLVSAFLAIFVFFLCSILWYQSKTSALCLQASFFYQSQSGKLCSIQENTILTSRENYCIYIKADKDCYVYVFQIDSQDKVFKLFPSSTYKTGSNPIKAHIETWLPPEEKDFFYLDETEGEEQIYLVACLDPISELENIEEIEQSSFQKITAPMGLKGIRSLEKIIKIKSFKKNIIESKVQEFTSKGAVLHKVKFVHRK